MSVTLRRSRLRVAWRRLRVLGDRGELGLEACGILLAEPRLCERRRARQPQASRRRDRERADDVLDVLVAMVERHGCPQQTPTDAGERYFSRDSVGAAASGGAGIAGVLPRSHQEVELAALHLIFEQPEAGLLTDGENLVDAVDGLAQFGARSRSSSAFSALNRSRSPHRRRCRSAGSSDAEGPARSDCGPADGVAAFPAGS